MTKKKKRLQVPGGGAGGKGRGEDWARSVGKEKKRDA